MRYYENLVIVKPTLTQEEIVSSINVIEQIITDTGAEITAQNAMGMRKLAYPIEKNLRGYFQVIYYKAEPSSISEIERRFRINEELLRFVTIKYDSKKEVKAWENAVSKLNTPVKSEEPVAQETPVETPTEPAVQETPAAQE